ncbi:MAG TPA: hypothetical protein VLG46_01350 [Anaerolineae bacterium]|nr:hypothetical protein [Anaerolineae bacterium]
MELNKTGRAGFGPLLHAEWTKFWTARGLVSGMVVAALLGTTCLCEALSFSWMRNEKDG